jgi:stearoyl-CoA desaturase (Delta-9 desaturase)
MTDTSASMPEASLEAKPTTVPPNASIPSTSPSLVGRDPLDDTLEIEQQSADLERVPWTKKLVTALVILIPIAGLIFGIAMLWGWGISWIHLVLLIVGYLATGHGVTVGYHRLFTHKSFDTGPVVKATLGVLGSMAIEGSIIKWVATHRMHHQHSDRENDPHSPHHEGEGVVGYLKGMWHSHMGWFFRPDPVNLNKYAKDLINDKLTKTISDLFPLWIVLGLLIPGFIAWAVTGSLIGGLLGVVWGGLVRVFLVHHVTWSINSACHLWGSKPFNSHDESRNNLLFGLLAWGEGWHNNHHAFPASARHGLSWWQVDTSYMIIRVLELLGLARNLRLPSPERVAAKRSR